MGDATTRSPGLFLRGRGKPKSGRTRHLRHLRHPPYIAAITLATGAGINLKGSAITIVENKTAILTFRRAGVAAWTVYVTVSA